MLIFVGKVRYTDMIKLTMMPSFDMQPTLSYEPHYLVKPIKDSSPSSLTLFCYPSNFQMVLILLDVLSITMAACHFAGFTKTNPSVAKFCLKLDLLPN